MATVYDMVAKKNGQGIYLGTYGYAEYPETALLTFDASDLNKENLDFRSMSLKKVGQKSSPSENGETIKRYDQDLKEALATIGTATSATSFTVASAKGLVAGRQIYNQNTGEVAVISQVAGTTITLYAPGFIDPLYATGNKLFKGGFGKKYGVEDGMTVTREDLILSENYMQIGERNIDSDLIENNKTYLFMDAKERTSMIFGDQSRSIMLEMATNFYIGKKAKQADSGTYRYFTGGLEEFIPNGAKVNIKGASNEDTKRKLRNELTKAYQSGISGINGANKLLFFCTTEFADTIDMLYEDKVVYVDKLNSINVEIKQYSVGGKKLNIVVSNVLDTIMGGGAVGYLVPIDQAFLHVFPRTTVEDSGKGLTRYGKGIVLAKPRTVVEKKQLALRTMYSFMFQATNSGAYRKLRYE